MGSLATNLTPFFEWLLRTTCQASLLIVLLLAVQKVFGRWLGVRGRYWLWFLVLIRMTMPWPIPSPASVYNLLPLRPAASTILALVDEPAPATRATSAAQASRPPEAGPDHPSARSSMVRLGPWLLSREPRLGVRATAALSLVWLAGVCCLTGCIGANHVRLHRVARRARPVAERWILDLLEECKGLIGTRTLVGAVVTDEVGGPALWGLFRPRLLLPRETVAGGNRAELRHIFLHELAHLRRHDILIGYVASMLHILHWFNPLIALGVRRMRADRELVCDGLVLSVLEAEEAPAYGRTLVLQIERLLAAPPRWTLAGLAGDGIRIKQRISMIALPRRHTYQWSFPALALFCLLALAGLTDAITRSEPPIYAPARTWPTTHEDKHGNIVRIHIRNRETGKYLVVRGAEVVCDVTEPGDAGLWEARFDDDFAGRYEIVYFYSVAARKYLTCDAAGKIGVNGLEPNDAARWNNWIQSDGDRITPHQHWGSYLEPDQQGRIRARDEPGSWTTWDIDQLWRVKTSDNPKSNPEWRKQYVPGPDWYSLRPGWPAPQ